MAQNDGRKVKKPRWRRGRLTNDKLSGGISLGCFFKQPVTEMQIFLDLSALVTVLHWFFRLVLYLAKRMFWVSDGLADDFQCFCHGSSVGFDSK